MFVYGTETPNIFVIYIVLFEVGEYDLFIMPLVIWIFWTIDGTYLCMDFVWDSKNNIPAQEEEYKTETVV